MPRLAVILHAIGDGTYLARGIIEDRTVFEHITFASLQEFGNYCAAVLMPRYRCTFNIPAEWSR